LTNDKKSPSNEGLFFYVDLCYDHSIYKGGTMIKDQLNEEQTNAFNIIVDKLRSKDIDPLIFYGYAGTGKSMTVHAVLQELSHMNIAKVAFTGRAASAINGITCHSLLYKPEIDDKGNLVKFVHRNASEVKEQCSNGIIVDESSMIPEYMHDELMGIGVPVIWVGDLAQLPPIDPNNPDFNVMNLEYDRIGLTQIMRVHDDSYGIQELSNHLRNKNTIPRRKMKGVRFVARGKATSLEFLRSNYFNVVICGMNKTRKKLNETIRAARGFHGETPNEGETVICLKNNVTENKKLFNGEIYVVEGILPAGKNVNKYLLRDTNGNTVTAVVEDDTWMTESANSPQNDIFGFGYAMTVHKSQGSSIERVLYIDEDVSFFLDQKKFRYTAVTRASKELTVAI